MIRPTRGASARAAGAATLACVVLAVLVAASVGAFFYAQALKREDPLVKRPRAYTDTFQPSGNQRRFDRDAHFDLRTSVGDVLEISVLTLSGRPVDVIETALRVREYVSVLLHWDGRTSAGTAAAPGLYELAVRFQHAGQTVIVPGFRLRLEGPTR